MAVRGRKRSPARTVPAAILCALATAWPLDWAPMDSVQRRLMEPAGFSRDDFDLLLNYPSELPRILPAVESLLRRPHGADSLVPALRRSLADTSEHGFVSSDGLWEWLGVAAPRPSASDDPEFLVRSVERNLKEYVAPLERGEIDYLLRKAPGLFLRRDEDTLLNPIEREIERLRGEATADSVIGLAGSLPTASLAAAARDLEGVLRFVLDLVRDEGAHRAGEKLRALGRRTGVPVSIGTAGRDVHRLDRGIVFDPGGDDRYEFPEVPRPGSWLLVIDLDGNDTWHAKDSAGGAAAFLSLRVLVDLAGDDRYLGGDFAFGSALMGYARLFDAAGDDVYEARRASLGFAFHGIGLLQDRSGNDLYSSWFLSQAAASTGGLALLLDGAGNDQYLARSIYPDDLRYRDRFLSLSQGFSSGFAPRHAGGIAVLWDRSGEDLYSADIFAQGSGYWFGWGLLMDDSGGDRYVAHQYAQGAGVHFAVGMLLDAEGNDLRVSKGVSQGCGHDGGFGLLADGGGDDRTVATDMSAGAGSANGLGVYVDRGGDDLYAMLEPARTMGHGDMRRDRGSPGFFLDLGGRDTFPAGFAGEPVWRSYDGVRRGEGYGGRGSREM